MLSPQKEVGVFDLVAFLDGLDAISLRVFTGPLGWEIEEVKVLVAMVRKDFLNSRLRIQHD
jgi:hypothetical protein